MKSLKPWQGVLLGLGLMYALWVAWCYMWIDALCSYQCKGVFWSALKASVFL